MLSAKPNTPEAIAHLSRMECSERIVVYIAQAGRRFEPKHSFWNELLQLLPPARLLRSGVLPHPTRFVAMTGITRRSIETVVEWIRPMAPERVHG